MSTINITYPMPCRLEQSQIIIDELLKDLADKYHIHHQSIGENHYQLKGSGIKGEVKLDHEELLITAQLNFMMMAFKPVIEKEIHHQLDKSFSHLS
jgi:putative polyhydroxyalkanoate system protein